MTLEITMKAGKDGTGTFYEWHQIFDFQCMNTYKFSQFLNYYFRGQDGDIYGRTSKKMPLNSTGSLNVNFEKC